jgi:hypothetical protein
MAVAEAKTEGLAAWLGAALSTALTGETASLSDLIARGLDEIAALHARYGVK